VQKVITNNEAGPFGMAQYFWRQLTPSFRFRCAFVTTECHHQIDPDTAVAFLSQMLHMQYQPPFNVTFFRYLWENMKAEFRDCWPETDESDIGQLVAEFKEKCDLMSCKDELLASQDIVHYFDC